MGRRDGVIVLDTHAWLWLYREADQLSTSASSAIARADRIGISAITCWEVALLAERRKIKLDRDVRLWVRQALAQERTEALPVTVEIAVEAALLPATFPGDPADRLNYSTARANSAQLVTKDERLRAFDSARALW